jgi:hypothetical protein
MDISAQATFLPDRPQRAVWVTSVRMRREDRSTIVISFSRRPRRVDYIIDSSSFHGGSFVRAWRPFLRPGLRVQTRRAQGAVKAGRRAGLASRFDVARPRLDVPELRGSRWTGRHRIGVDARKSALLVENRPRDAGELVGERNGEHVVV